MQPAPPVLVILSPTGIDTNCWQKQHHAATTCKLLLLLLYTAPDVVNRQTSCQHNH